MSSQIIMMDVINIVNSYPHPNNHQFQEDYSPNAWLTISTRTVNGKIPEVALACKLVKPIDGKPYANDSQIYFNHY